MECVVNEADNFGYIKISNVDYSDIVNLGVIRPSAWMKYLQFARDWITDRMLVKGAQKFAFETLSIHLSNTKELCNFNCVHFEVVSPYSKKLRESTLKLISTPLQISFVILAVDGPVFINRFVVTNLSTSQIVTIALVQDKLVEPAVIPDIALKLSTIPRAVEHMKNLELSIHTKRPFKASYPVTFSYTDPAGAARIGFFTDMCHNCADEAVRKQYTSSFVEMICLYTAKSISAKYFRKAHINDMVVVEMWESVKDPLTLEFQASLDESRELLCLCKISFYEMMKVVQPQL